MYDFLDELSITAKKYKASFEALRFCDLKYPQFTFSFIFPLLKYLKKNWNCYFLYFFNYGSSIISLIFIYQTIGMDHFLNITNINHGFFCSGVYCTCSWKSSFYFIQKITHLILCQL